MYLSEFIKRPVINQRGEKIGKLKDVIVSSESPYPIIEAITVETLDKKQINVPWEYVENMVREIKLKSELDDIKEYNFAKRDIKLLEDVMDRQVVDIEDQKIRRVNDLKISATNGYYHIIGVDIGIQGIIRRLGLQRITKPLGIAKTDDIIAWNDIDPLESDYSKLKLKVPKQNLKKLHPADIAEIVDQLGVNESITILNSLDDESAADTLEEVSPERQVSLFEGMDSKRAADLLDEMSPDDAADLLGDLPDDKAEELLGLMKPEESKDLRKLLEYPENTAGGIMTTEFAYVDQDLTVRKVLDAIRKMAEDVETLYYVYVISKKGDLVGVTSLRDIILADLDANISDFMHTHIIKADVMEDQHEVAQKIAKYNLIALPVVEDETKLRGIITVDDAIDIVLPTAWKKRVPRMFGR
ncbi:magnesium transporter MgtE N-terminal domain-containing protein [Methanobacterium paludis]|uniref:MgtE intracellular region n=1 Tax=Methanobacterium paludis (strain DSM 25820 / JCM 18151 / SWAN1) TaxID=868131 RepID=F6D5F0_METPW|nr:CBS domain-containing protein [Methanobacterium paludis]AEG19302.1 MgtE intracellular region [Methanobacterium paludis]